MANQVKKVSTTKQAGAAKAAVETKAAVAEVKKFTKGRMITCDGVVVKSVSSPSSIQRVAIDKGINPQEVFVRVTFEFKGEEFAASNKLRFLTKAGYQELLDAEKSGTKMKFVVDIDNGFFYVEKDVSIDSLFAQEVEKKDTRKPLSALL
jgi:hypothetical protein